MNAASADGGPSLDLALFGVATDSFLVSRPDARAALAGEPGLVLARELEDDGVKIGDRYKLGGSDEELPVLGFTFAGTYGHAPIAFVSLETWQQIQLRDRGPTAAFPPWPSGATRRPSTGAAAETGVEVLISLRPMRGHPATPPRRRP